MAAGFQLLIGQHAILVLVESALHDVLAPYQALQSEIHGALQPWPGRGIDHAVAVQAEPLALDMYAFCNQIRSETADIEYSKTRRKNDCEVMLDLIREFPGMTAGEYGQILLERGYKPMKAIRMPTKRISDIKEQLIVGRTRKCSVSERRAQTYYVREDYL